MTNLVLQIIMRWLHIVSAMVIVGGTTFLITCGMRAVRPLEDALRADILKNMQERFLRLVMIGIAGLIISGVYGWIVSADKYRAMGPAANALIGTKVLLAAILFVVVFARAAKLIGPDKARFWHMFNLHLALIVVLLASILRCWRVFHFEH